MIPYLISNRFDIQRLKDRNGKYLFTSDNLALYVQSSNPSIPENMGVGQLTDCISCTITHNPTGYDELEMEYPCDGELFSDLELRSLIIAKVDGNRGNQAYRIYKITKPISGRVKIYARHIAYDLMGIVCAPFTADNLTQTLSKLKSKAMSACPFTFQSTRTVNVPFEVKVPTQIWTLMGTDEDYLIGRYNGEYLFDNYTINFEDKLGEDNGVEVIYGVNLTDFQQEAACDECYTGVVGYWEYDGDCIYSDVIGTGGRYSYIRVMTVDMSTYWSDKPSYTELTNAVREYIQANNIGVPKVTWTINYIPLSSTEEYKNIAGIDRVSIGDTVRVYFDRLNVKATARVNEIEWNVLLDRYNKISLGDVKSTISSTIARTISILDKTPDKNEVIDISKMVSERLTKAMLGASGGVIRFMDTDSDGVYDTLYIADNDDPLLAQKVWRFNYEGWAASENGFNGPFKMGATLADGFLADFITAANLTAGDIRSVDGVNYWNLNTGELRISPSTQIGSGGRTVGQNISSVDVQYASGTSSTTAPTTGWSTNAPQWQSGRYIWTRTKVVDGAGQTSYSTPTCIQGANGETGIGVSAIVEQYYLSTSNTTRSGGSWSALQPAWEEGKYIWTRSKITWTDNTVTYTDPILANAINGANEAVADLDNSLDQTGVFNRLTNNGAIQGLYMENGNLYVNASYIKSGQLAVGGVNNQRGIIRIYDNVGECQGEISANTQDLFPGQHPYQGEATVSMWESWNNAPVGRCVVLGSSGIYFQTCSFDPNDPNHYITEELAAIEFETDSVTGKDRIRIKMPISGIVDCKSLYVNGRQIT